MPGSLRKPSAPRLPARCFAGRSVVASTLLLGLGCGQDVLVGNLQLRSLSDAGAEIAEAAEADAGVNPQAAAAEGARRDAEQRSLSHDHTGDKSH